jgi:hypothetical protein
MKVLVLHDRQGIIRRVVTAPADAPIPVHVGAHPGEILSEVEVPDKSLDPSTEEGQREMVRILREFRVDLTRQARLVPRRSSEG